MALLAKYLILLVWATMVIIECNGGALSLFPPKTTVEIINMITNPPQSLTFHCKSKDDDIGEQKIFWVGEKFKFHFKPNFIGTTLFYCNFSWPSDTSSSSHYFDIYVQRRDQRSCVAEHKGGVPLLCSWKIWKTVACKFNEYSGHYTDCYTWNHPPTMVASSIVNASHV
ncbi:hypothetical protein K1719_045906 [Acacia pycnantha]|nr:hypothetical protein K1719_045906 [Acacia pycnantha]